MGFLAYDKHRDVARAFDVCFASLAITATLAIEFQNRSIIGAGTKFQGRLREIVRSGRNSGEVVGEPWRQATELIRVCADEMPSASFSECLAIPNVE